MNDFDIIFGTGEVKPVNKTLEGVKLPELPMDSEGYVYEKASSASKVTTSKIERTSFTEDCFGDCADQAALPAPLIKYKRADDQTLSVLQKGGSAGKFLAKSIVQVGGLITEGMSNVYELFFDKFLATERELVEKAIKTADVAAFHQLLIQAFERV